MVSAEHGYAIVHKGPERDKQLILISHDGHYDVITSLPGFFSKVYFCLDCEKGFDHNDLSHHCCPGNKCWCCHQTDCPDFETKRKQGLATIDCPECNRKFFGDTCWLNHVTKTSSGQPSNVTDRVCCTYRECNICHTTYNLQKIKEHRCGEQECPCCHRICNLKQHKCFIQPIKKKKKKKRDDEEEEEENEEDDEFMDEDEDGTIFIYFDIEARQDKGNHVANLLCAETDHNNQQYTFWGESCVADFLQWCYHLAHQADVEQLVVVAHNFKGYDGYMIMEQLYKEHITQQLYHIVNGTKILTLSIPQIKFIDSLNFLPMALAEFPKTFGLTELQKGFFPHFFNKQENEMYVGYVPDKQYYDPDGMSPTRKKEFETWCNDQVRQRVIFHFQQDLLKYCQSDVRLLKEGCIQFQKSFKQVAGFNAMLNCITIAQACGMAYRRNWMPKNTIAVQPLHGRRPTHNHSRAALEWLCWQEHKLLPTSAVAAAPPHIAHAGNQGERLLDHGPLQRFLVDGYDATTNTVYEFHGCF